LAEKLEDVLGSTIAYVIGGVLATVLTSIVLLAPELLQPRTPPAFRSPEPHPAFR
jgi:hypothetical protein